MKKLLLLIILFTGCIMSVYTTFAQVQKVAIEGTVTDEKTGESIPGCMVGIPILDIWAVTNGDGHFRMPSVTTGKYTIEVTCLGYEKLSYDVNIVQSVPRFNLRLTRTSLEMDKVTVTTTRGESMTTSSSISRQAMDHIQTGSLGEVMQLLPGVVTENPDLTSASKNVISIRDLQVNTNRYAGNAYGTAIYVDGAQANDKASIAMTGSGLTGVQTVGQGYDTRRITTDNIESIEVLRGVVSAEYGDLTSGAVIVRTKAGRTPYEMRFKTDEKTKLVAFGKGFALGSKAGFMNTGLDFTRSYKDTRTDEDSYSRITFDLGYSNTFNNDRTPLHLNVKLNGYYSGRKTKSDPDNLSKDERSKLDDRALSLNINGNWNINKPWLTSLKFVMSSRVNREYTEDIHQTSSVAGSASTFESGEFEVDIMPGTFLSQVSNHSMAIYNTAKLTADISEKYGSVFNNFKLGAEWKNMGNTGRGMEYFGEQRPQGFRYQSPKEMIPFVNDVSAFVENKTQIPVGATQLTLQAGVRFIARPNKVIDNKTAWDPRMNIRYDIIRNKRGSNVKDLNLSIGWGIQTVLPSLSHMYSFYKFNDIQSLAVRTIDDGVERERRYMTTFVTTPEEQINKDLKFQRSNNINIELGFNMFGVKGSIVYFREKMRNGYSTSGGSMPNAISYREYTYDGSRGTPSYINDPVEGRILAVNGVPLEYTLHNVFRTLSLPSNDRKMDKWGIEYDFDFGHIRAIRTSVVINGAYMQMKQRDGDGTLYHYYPTQTKVVINGKSVYLPFVGIYNGARNSQLGTNNDRLSTSVNFITHIPKLRLVTSLTIECVWRESRQSLQNSDLYTGDVLNGEEPVYGDYSKGTDKTLYMDPLYYMTYENGQYTVREFNQSLYNDPVYGNAFRELRYVQSNGNFFTKSSFSPYFMANIKITKEIANLAQVSFFANNITDSHPKRFGRNLETYYFMNTPFYCGLEVKLKF